jgi:hypothetical protein
MINHVNNFLNGKIALQRIRAAFIVQLVSYIYYFRRSTNNLHEPDLYVNDCLSFLYP